jgi:uncharacterized protein YcaQ
MTAKRKDFQKVYDLPENLVPGDIDTTPPTPEEFARHIILRALKTLGIAYFKDIAFNARYVKNSIKEELKKLVASGQVLEIAVTGVKDTAPLYMLPAYKSKKITLAGDAFILSPFDILNVLRHRLLNFFDFDYQVECFVPAAKRKYGYFSLPILIGDTFIARMDSKADRKQKTLIIHNLHLESIKLTKPHIAKLCDAIKAFAEFNQCQEITLRKCNDKSLLKVMQKELA